FALAGFGGQVRPGRARPLAGRSPLGAPSRRFLALGTVAFRTGWVGLPPRDREAFAALPPVPFQPNQGQPRVVGTDGDPGLPEPVLRRPAAGAAPIPLSRRLMKTPSAGWDGAEYSPISLGGQAPLFRLILRSGRSARLEGWGGLDPSRRIASQCSSG